MSFSTKKWDDIMKEHDEEERLEQIMKGIINPKDIGVTFGKPMTEAEFLEHRKNNPGEGPPHIIQAGQRKMSEPINISENPKKKLQEKLDAMKSKRTG
jgi:hypothetical protein